MKGKNRKQNLSDAREVDGSYDQLTGEYNTYLYIEKYNILF